ncbi:MAG TPA: pyridoxal-phosphate dependent enzyme [Thermomicrobiaceae bacterium]|nr:pyridoxal-phosphate dependent enzyme [Thermomicrobiaceae bacterium]
MIHPDALSLIGETPLVRFNAVARGVRGTVAGKLEMLNPGGSIKDRIGLRMIEDAERRGLLGPGGTIIEPTSGNTGAGLAMVAAIKGYRCICVVPTKVSSEKIAVLRAYGAEVVVVPPSAPETYYQVADRLTRTIPGAYQPYQYGNPVNPASHYSTTGPEIWRQTEGRITHLVAGAGTGGTITGIARYLKEQNPSVRVIAADPEGSIYTNPEHPRGSQVEGIGKDFWPAVFDRDLVDEFVQVRDADSFAMARRVSREEGILIGGSGGTAVWVALEAARRADDDRTLAVVILPDGGRGYLSKVYDDAWLAEHHLAGDTQLREEPVPLAAD